MDPTLNDHQEFEQVEAIDDLLEDFWFFDNLLGRRSTILRYCHSDPYPFSPSSPSSSSTHPKPEVLNTGDSVLEKKLLEALTVEDSVPPPCLEKEEGGGETEKMKKITRQFSEKIRAQERTTYLQKKEPVVHREKGVRESTKKNRTGRSSCNNKSVPMGGSLQRTQTLPTYIGREGDRNEFDDQESDDSRMGYLIREAIASSSSGFTTPTKQNTPKMSSIPRHRPPRNSRSEETIQEMAVKSQGSKTLRKTLSSIDTKEIMTLKELDITEPEKKQEKDDEEQRRVVKSRSAVVVGQPIPVWVPNESRRDMKAQIKFWARTVASNVRQEC
ncbi:uncharacterized protein LOC103869954 [Brassica rapa]|uniref:Uncharacterized protein n=1 Tax=Brassica campestris TaxID=3711 RepID=M4EER5_BRACM|nr:uncharacterized protein LOC103869954 [Brassica rapa]